MHNATSRIAIVASTYASHVPLPANAQTRGMVAAGVVVGAIVETDCASVSIGERMSRRNPYPAACGLPGTAVSVTYQSSFSPNSSENKGGNDTGVALFAQELFATRIPPRDSCAARKTPEAIFVNESVTSEFGFPRSEPPFQFPLLLRTLARFEERGASRRRFFRSQRIFRTRRNRAREHVRYIP